MQSGDLFGLMLIFLAPFCGSFLALLADRLPRGENVVWRRSFCRSCGHSLGVLDLLPLVSFAMLRGRCRQCRAAIPPQTLYFEIAATGLAVIAVIATGGFASAVASTVFLWLLMTLAVTDLTWFRLPDLLTFMLFVVAIVLAVCPAGLVLGRR